MSGCTGELDALREAYVAALREVSMLVTLGVIGVIVLACIVGAIMLYTPSHIPVIRSFDPKRDRKRKN